MRFIWVRHGETLWNREFRLQGTSDVALSEDGLRQAGLLAAAFTEAPDRIFVSPLQRARAFAAPLADRFGVQPKVVEELREMSFGQWEGLRYEDMDEQMQKAFELWCEDPVYTCPPGGEAAAGLAGRVRQAIELMVAGSEPQQTAAVFTHGGVIRVAVTLLMEMPPAAAGRMQIDTGSVTILDFTGGRWRLVKLNDTGHLRQLSC